VLAQTQLLFFSALAFVWLNLRGLYPPELHSTNLDAEWFYRRLFPVAIRNLLVAAWKLDGALRLAFVTRLHQCLDYLSGIYQVPSGLLTSARPAGSMAMWVAIFLAGYLFFSFFY
jgi:multicomponent Na+:H+ antiporter subunit D